MIDCGVNPHIRGPKGNSNYDFYGLSNLVNVPSIKSVFYSIQNFPSGNFGDPWCYTTGVYDGKYARVIGRGGEGIVLEGVWKGQPVAYKFVQINGLIFGSSYEGAVVDMNERLKEMTEMIATPGDAILPFEAHFR